MLINSHSNLTLVGFIGDVIVSHESDLGGYEFHLGGHEFHLGGYEFLEVWCWLKTGLDQTGPIREDLGDSCRTDHEQVQSCRTDTDPIYSSVSDPCQNVFLGTDLDQIGSSSVVM